MSLATYTAVSVRTPTEKLLSGVLFTEMLLSCISFIEPSPYDFLFLLLAPIALASGFIVTQTTITLFFLLTSVIVWQFIALTPYIQHRPIDGTLTPTVFTILTAYLYITAVFFAFIFSTNTKARLGLMLKGYAFSCVIAAIWGVLSFMNVAGIGAREPILGRIAGPFKDPNVMGSFCVIGVLYFVQSMIFERRFTLLKAGAAILVFVGGVFFTLSRGSMGATLFALAFMIAAAYATSDYAVRRRILVGGALAIFLAVGGVSILAASTNYASFVGERVQLVQEYDGGETGRFGNQKRSINMLLSRPLGFGAFRFPLFLPYQPHNSYIGAFSDTGWIGGLTFFLTILVSAVLAARLAFARTPFIREAQIIGPAAIGFFLQAFQIDIDHWRFFFLLLGAVWGMESARRSLFENRPKTATARNSD